MKNIFLFFSLILLLFYPQDSSAYTKTQFGTSPQGGFAVSPGKTEISLNAGETKKSEIIIINRNNFSADFFLSTEDFVGTDEDKTGVKLLGDISSAYSSLKDFIFPEIQSFTLQAGEKITLSVDISAPKNASPRGYYGALIVSSSKKNNKSDQIENIITSRIASLFLVEINGDKNPEGKLENFKISGPRKNIYLEYPKSFEVGFKNTGNIHLSPTGEIILKNIFGRTIQQLEIKDFIILPNTTRQREIQLQDKFLFGRYEALASISNGYNNQKEEMKLTFWVFPWKICLYAVLFLLLIVFVLRIISKLFFWNKRKRFSPNKNLN